MAEEAPPVGIHRSGLCAPDSPGYGRDIAQLRHYSMGEILHVAVGPYISRIRISIHFIFTHLVFKYQQHFSVQLKLLPILVRQAKTTDLDDENRCSQCHDTAPTRNAMVMSV